MMLFQVASGHSPVAAAAAQGGRRAPPGARVSHVGSVERKVENLHIDELIAAQILSALQCSIFTYLNSL